MYEKEADSRKELIVFSPLTFQDDFLVSYSCIEYLAYGGVTMAGISLCWSWPRFPVSRPLGRLGPCPLPPAPCPACQHRNGVPKTTGIFEWLVKVAVSIYFTLGR